MVNNTIIRQFNKFQRTNKSFIRKALDSATGKGEALIPQKLEQIITNTVVRLSPELAMIEPEFDNQKFHDYNQLLTLPAAGGAMGEGAVTPTRNSTYARKQVALKVVRRKGAVTNFLQDTSGKYIDASAAEMENHLQSHAYDLATYMLYGNALADPYTFDGLDSVVVTNRMQESIGGAILTLPMLDDMIDENLTRQGATHKKAFVMSVKMLSKASQLLTNVRLNQGIVGNGITQVDVGGGWRLNAYRDIPIIVTNATRPTGTMTTVSTAYYFRVAPVTYDGEQIASAEVTQTTGGSVNTHTITLSFTAYPGALFYKVYMGTVSGTVKLMRVFSAFTYDGSGTITGNNTSLVITAPTKGAEVTTKQADDLPLNLSASIPNEIIMLWDFDKYQGVGKVPYTNTAGSKFNGLVTINPLAITDDDLPFLIKSYLALCPSFEATCVVRRGVKTA